MQRLLKKTQRDGSCVLNDEHLIESKNKKTIVDANCFFMRGNGGSFTSLYKNTGNML